MDHVILEGDCALAAYFKFCEPGPAPAAPPAPHPLAGGLVQLRRQVLLTLSELPGTAAAREPVSVFAEGLKVAIELAGIVGAPEAPDAPAGSAARATASDAHRDGGPDLDDIVELANRALDQGLDIQGLIVLASVGYLIGGPLQAALELANGLLRLNRRADAAACLHEAVESVNDCEGVAGSVLAWLWCDAGDGRWVAQARRVLATANDLDARTRCRNLLAEHGQG